MTRSEMNAELDRAGINQRHEISALPLDSKIELPTLADGVIISPRTWARFTSVPDWIADVRRRGIEPVAPNH